VRCIAIAGVLAGSGRHLFTKVSVNAYALDMRQIARRDAEGGLIEQSRGIARAQILRSGGYRGGRRTRGCRRRAAAAGTEQAHEEHKNCSARLAPGKRVRLRHVHETRGNDPYPQNGVPGERLTRT
jgi:hypothetical protein